MVRIITNETPTEEIQRRFFQELQEQGKAAALEMGCSVEELKYRVNNAGIIQWSRMDAQEMIDMAAHDVVNKSAVKIKKDRGVFDV